MTLDEAKEILREADVYLDSELFEGGSFPATSRFTVDGALNLRELEAVLVLVRSVVKDEA